ncbi:hypothetical protein SARC_06693 [Sphaeroforma arctica JP610]|uniref:Uncharacterized protein n=1 Tax=Sphaeroforma arctica JP610 TaxID=667725 RepID=A0A0L0FWM1_9EUKA|nr:hypothetical protein SARC_06693 [Sphaeroforma arctica JP610]KNC80961.1 hypothetical protein SARC_06693 [Sphaeroforma arctica JP610]|eukprot:XP_014154863.1 hypothetical protein SARC_06693 [Sphaeroforma arctica JP610]
MLHLSCAPLSFTAHAPLSRLSTFLPQKFDIENSKDINFPMIDESDVENFDYDTIGKGVGNNSSDGASDRDDSSSMIRMGVAVQNYHHNTGIKSRKKSNKFDFHLMTARHLLSLILDSITSSNMPTICSVSWVG